MFKKLWNNLFPGPKAFESQKLNIGKIIATVKLKRGEDIRYTFIGEYTGDKYYAPFNIWVPQTEKAKIKFNNWKQQIADSQFLRVNGQSFVPIFEIDEIVVDEKELIVETYKT